MWRFLTPSSTRAAARRAPVRRPRQLQPHCTPLEDRCLLSVSLADIAPPVPFVGSPVVWLASSRGLGPRPVYRFSVEPLGGPLHIVRDFSLSPGFVWNPMQQGIYLVRVDVKSGFAAPTSEAAIAAYAAQPRAVGNRAVISPMANPLVALYSAPPAAGAWMFVQFARLAPALSWQSTSPLPIVPGQSTNFIVAGMLPNTTYVMRHVTSAGHVSPPLLFTTRGLPANLRFPTFSVVQPPAPGIDLTRIEIFHAGLFSGSAVDTLATDLSGNVIWYYDPVANAFPGYAQNLEPGGTVMILGGNAVGVAGGFDTLRQVDLAGDTLRETNIYALNARLTALHQPQIIDFDHEAKLLPNGNTVVLAATPKTVNYRGKPTKFIGAEVIVLDANFQPVWVWNSFRWLSTNRLGTDNPTPTDWLHANSVSWSPADGNLVVSLRTQDWAIKITYANGTGNGHIVWKLGAGGNFNAITNARDPWFSHQHDVRYINNSTLLVFDDGNTRQATSPSAHSRGQEWILNEQNRTAALVVNADMGNYSDFLGSAERLPNGNLAFTSGGLTTSAQNPKGETIEVLPNGTRIYVQRTTQFQYRSYFESTLYSADLVG